jgi:hypothetical protein
MNRIAAFTLPLRPAFICNACGTQYRPSEAPPDTCPVCVDERQYVPASGQTWTTLERLQRAYTTNSASSRFRELAPGLMTIKTVPAFGINQRAILARTPSGNVLWDCIALIDDATVELLKGLGGVIAIAISHPHYYTTMVEWSRARGGVPLHLHAADRQWVLRPAPPVQFWDGDTKSIGPGSRWFGWEHISRAAPCCTGRTGMAAAAWCSRETSCR